jgi:hypothetical protein
MPRAELTLTIPEDIWIGDISRSYPDARFRILAVLPADDDGVGLAEITADPVQPLLDDIDAHGSVRSLEILSRQEGTALVQFETTNPLLLFPIRGSGIPLELPFELVDGNAVWELTAPRDRLSKLGEQLEEFGIPFRVDRIEQQIASEQLLTETQADLVRAAVDAGYYDTPRDCSLTELSEQVDIAKSTCSETLHRAEEQIIKSFVEQETPGDATGQTV